MDATAVHRPPWLRLRTAVTQATIAVSVLAVLYGGLNVLNTWRWHQRERAFQFKIESQGGQIFFENRWNLKIPQWLKNWEQIYDGICSVELREGSPPGELLTDIRSLPRLKWLGMNRTDLTDDDLTHLATLKHLEGLSLVQTSISDAGLRHLESLKDLKTLSLDLSKTTEAGRARLRAALPHCKITPDP